MSEKEEALQHLSEIKSVLVDKDAFFPYNYNALIVWGIIGMIMTIFMGILMKTSILYGSTFAFIMMTSGFLIESFLVKRVNEKYDIEDCTKKQKFISTLYTVLTFFAIAISALLAKYNLIAAAYVVWIFVCSIGYLALGFILNIGYFTKAGFVKVAASITLIVASIFVEDLGRLDSTFFYIVQGATFFLLGIIPIMIARKLKEEL